MKVSEVLTQARAAIVEKGWSQGAYMKGEDGSTLFEAARDYACSFCLLGAVNYVVPDTVNHWIALRNAAKVRLMWALDTREKAVADSYLHLPDWNDAPERTKQDVIALYELAIERAREEEVLV